MNEPQSTQRSKTALVLAAGGVAGAVYEIGTLCAIDDLLVEHSVNDFDMYVGTSAGAIVAACLVNGIPARTLFALLNSHVFGIRQLEPHHLFSFDPVDVLGRTPRLPVALLTTFQRILREGRQLSLLDLFETLAVGFPTGLYDTAALEQYLREVFSRAGRSNDFRALAHELAIIATDLNTGQRAVFGQPPLDNVPISHAVSASSALPLFYQPVRIGESEYIDGGIRGTVSLDVAIERGAELIICINPLVPFDNSRRSMGRSMGEQDVQKIGNQVFRTFIHAGLHYHLKQVRRRHPNVDIILIEPRPDDRVMFSENTMRYHSRLTIARHGFETVANHLADHDEHYRELLARHGVQIDVSRVLRRMDALRRAGTSPRALRDALGATLPRHTHSTGLAQTLAELDRLLDQLEYKPAM